MIEGPSCRNLETQLAYDKRMTTRDGCEFCRIDEKTALSSKATCWVIRNIFPYILWDDLEVEDHLLMVPKRHVLGLNEFTEEERRDYFSVVDEYEDAGYSIYSRAPSNKAKSVAHQHTHLIKVDNSKPPIDYKLYVRKPFTNIWGWRNQ